jgi:hypothetical protein
MYEETYEEQYREIMGDSVKYSYGGHDPSVDFEDRIFRYQQLVKQPEKWKATPDSEKETLKSTYNPHMYRVMSATYSNASAATNKDIEYIQNYLATTGFYEDEVDGMYGKNTKAAMKKYIYDHSKTDMWNQMKDIRDSFIQGATNLGSRFFKGDNK